MRAYFYNKNKISRRLILDFILSLLSVLFIIHAPMIGKAIGVAAFLFIGYDQIKLFKLGMNRKPQLIWRNGTLEFALGVDLKFAAASIIQFERKTLGNGLFRLLFHDIRLEISRSVEINGRMFDKKETIDITFLKISEPELEALLSNSEPVEEQETGKGNYEYEEGNLEYGNFFFGCICFFFAYRSAFDYKSLLSIENEFDRANPVIAILRAIDMMGGQALVVDLFLTGGIYLFYEVFRQIMAKRNR
jgi:hypothetical protein